MAKIPDFTTLDEEVEFWESHDSADYWDDMESVTFEVDLHRNLLHPKLVVLSTKPANCPRCGGGLKNIAIEYVAWKNRRLTVLRDVPALKCPTNGHKYILDSTLDEIEYLLEGAQVKRQPIEMIQVPVFRLSPA